MVGHVNGGAAARNIFQAVHVQPDTRQPDGHPRPLDADPVKPVGILDHQGVNEKRKAGDEDVKECDEADKNRADHGFPGTESVTPVSQPSRTRNCSGLA